MLRLPVRFALAAGLLVGLATTAAAQTGGVACTTPFDPNCNHLKCYQIKDTASIVVSKTPLLQVANQFGTEVLYRLQPFLLCVPSQKACCCPQSPGCQPGVSGCSVANCAPNPVNAPGLPHFKCYKIKAKTCPNGDCTQKAVAFTKGTLVNLRDQFGLETNVPVGNPVVLCAPAFKEHGPTTTTTNTTSTTTTTTTSTTTTTNPPQFCHDDPVLGCTGPCPPTFPPGSQCIRDTTGKCGCVAPPVCCECPGNAASPPYCQNTNAQCPSNCITFANASCDPATRHCVCGFCHDTGTPTGCTNIPCSISAACPAGTYCDFACTQPPTPAPCDPCKTQQPGTCSPVQCVRNDGTQAVCRVPQLAGATCDCCGPTNAPCTSDFDCCSGVCNVTANSCQ